MSTNGVSPLVNSTPVRKDAGETTANILINHPPQVRGLNNSVDSILDSLDEPLSQRRITLGVLSASPAEYPSNRFRAELITASANRIPRTF